jgi:hypothetical protein
VVFKMDWQHYVMSYPDLVQNYEEHWKHKGVSVEEFGQMHARNDPGRMDSYQQSMSGGGGGGGGYSGGGGGQAQAAEDAYRQEIARQEQAAKDAEAKRKAETNKNNKEINSKFDERSKQFDEYGNKLYEHNEGLYNDAADDARGEVNYALARSGQSGGTAGVDSRTSFEDSYQKGLTNLRSGSTSAANQLKSQDNGMRNNLLQASSAGSYNSAMSNNLTGVPQNMSQLNAGVGNQFQSLLGGIGGASMRGKNPFGGY